MTCEKSRALMNAYIDDYITDDELVELNEHLDACEACTIEFEELKYMKEILGETSMKALPKDFEKKLHERLLLENYEGEHQNDKVSDRQGHHKLIDFKGWSAKKIAKWGGLAVAAVLVIGISVTELPSLMNYTSFDTADTATSSNSLENDIFYGASASVEGIDEDNNMAAADFAEPEENFSDGGADMKMFASSNAVESNGDRETGENTIVSQEDDYREGRLIIQTASVNIEVENFDQVEKDLKFFIEQREGYLANESVDVFDNQNLNRDLKRGHYTIKVPTSTFEDTLDYLKDFGNVNYYNIDAQDVTKNYRDLANEIENLKVTEERLREILIDATEVEDILKIENELSRVRANINRYTQQIKSWEDLADFSTIDLNINEVASLEPVIEPVDHSIWTQAKNGLVKTLNHMIQFVIDMLIWFIAYSPIIVILVIAGFLGRHFYKKRQLKGKKVTKKEE